MKIIDKELAHSAFPFLKQGEVKLKFGKIVTIIEG